MKTLLGILLGMFGGLAYWSFSGDNNLGVLFIELIIGGIAGGLINLVFTPSKCGNNCGNVRRF